MVKTDLYLLSLFSFCIGFIGSEWYLLTIGQSRAQLPHCFLSRESNLVKLGLNKSSVVKDLSTTVLNSSSVNDASQNSLLLSVIGTVGMRWSRGLSKGWKGLHRSALLRGPEAVHSVKSSISAPFYM